MTVVFADTSYYLALLNRRDRNHAPAQELSRRLVRLQVTTDFVLLEVGNALSGLRAGRERFAAFVAGLLSIPHVTVLEANRRPFEQGLRLYRERLDKTWSVTDCISFIAMRDHGITEALSSDHHFEQAGFTILLK